MPLKPNNQLKKAFTTGHFHLTLDGAQLNGYLKAIEGGFVKSAVVDQAIGSHLHRVKHTSTVEVEPYTLELGFAGARPILKWIEDSWRMEASRRGGVVAHADFDHTVLFEHEFSHALITETTFPALDGASKEAAYLKVKIQPENVRSRRVPPYKLDPFIGQKQKMWAQSHYRLTLDGFEELAFANKIESFTIKQGVKKLHIGEQRFPHIEPTNVQFPNITGTIGLVYADRLLKWYDKYVCQGQVDPAAQTSGSLEYLSPDLKTVLLRVNLFEVGLSTLQMLPSGANGDSIKRVKFELFVGRMELDASAPGLE